MTVAPFAAPGPSSIAPARRRYPSTRPRSRPFAGRCAVSRYPAEIPGLPRERKPQNERVR